MILKLYQVQRHLNWSPILQTPEPPFNNKIYFNPVMDK